MIVKIDRDVTFYKGDVQYDGEITIEVEGKVNADGQAEIVRAYKPTYWWPSDSYIEEDTELSDREEASALEKLQAMANVLLAEQAERAHDARVDQAKEDRDGA